MKSVESGEYKKFFFEISGKCQAKCPHCCTGNRSLRSQASRFVPVEDFTAATDRLLEQGVIGKSTQFDLYNWGEPFLHPDLRAVLTALVVRGLRFRLSTNGGVYQELPDAVVENINQLTITIPGFSQESYNKVHGLDFQNVLKNIGLHATSLGPERLKITFLVHQFNLGEVGTAYRYFQKRNIAMGCTVAYMNDYNMARDYLAHKMTADQLRGVGRDLLLSHVEDLLRSRPVDYVCPQFSLLAADEYCRVLTCCAVPKGHSGYSIGSIAELTASEIRSRKLQQGVCKECQKYGLDYWIHTPPQTNYLEILTGENLRIYELCRMLGRKIDAQARRIASLAKGKLMGSKNTPLRG